MVNLINEAKKIDHPVLIHVLTKKGKGYKYAEHFPAKFHGIDPFYVKTGELKNKKNYKTYTNVFSKTICKLANEDKKIVAITAAMEDGCGLADFKKMYPDRFVDVGIAEEHAVTFAGGLSTCGFKPYFAVYSSFLQRGYDEIIHDICIQNLPVKFMVDRAGIVGSDGETHQGIFDISYLLSMPNMTVISPSTSKELERAILFANEYDKPIAVRYPRGEVFDLSEDLDDRDLYEYGKSRIVSEGRDVCIIAVGSSLKEALVAKKILNDKGINPKVVDARFIKPFDRTLIDETINDIKLYVTIEEGVINGGFGREVMGLLNDDYYDKSCRCINIGIKDTFVEQGAPDILKKIYGLDGNYISKTIIDALNMENI